MGGASGILAAAVIVGICLFVLFLLPKGLTGVTTAVIVDNGITFENPSPAGTLEIAGNCFQEKLQLDYHLNCAMCESRTVDEFFWFRNSEDKEFTLLKGDRKMLHPGVGYTAEMKVDICRGNSYEWYVCIDDTTLKCAGKEKPFGFKVI